MSRHITKSELPPLVAGALTPLTLPASSAAKSVSPQLTSGVVAAADTAPVLVAGKIHPPAGDGAGAPTEHANALPAR